MRVVDTGGIIPEDKELIPSEIFRQARVALEEADAIVMVVDGRTELASPDMELARLLLRTGKPLVLAVNKMDTPKLEPYAEEFRRLGHQGADANLRRERQRRRRVTGARVLQSCLSRPRLIRSQKPHGRASRR